MARSLAWRLSKIHRRAWRGYAVECIKIFAEAWRGELFIAPDMIATFERQGFRRPNDVREWGPALQDAEELGYVMRCGKIHSTKPSRKYSKTTLWYAL